MEPLHRTMFYIELIPFRQELEHHRDMAQEASVGLGHVQRP